MTAAALPLRRTWLAEQLHPHVAAGTFMRIFEAVSPAKARAVRGESGARIYSALLAYLGTLIPIYEPAFDDWGQANEPDGLEQAIEYGIPVDLYGFDESAISYEDSYDPALALIWWLIPEDFDRWDVIEIDDLEQDLRHSDMPAALKKHTAALKMLSDRAAHRKWTKPPRSRQWKGVWEFLPDVYAYVTHTTGCGFLDYSNNETWEAGEMPPWNIDEVRGAIQDWKRGAPMWEGIKALVTYVGENRHWLLDLGLALTGDDETRLKLSEPKRKGKTLAQIFAKEARHA